MASGADASASRASTRDKLVNHMASQSVALSILMGDWNYATTSTNRFTKATAEWSGASDEAEHPEVQSKLANEFNLFELYQDGLTCDNGLARSRIDRVYTNHHSVEQLDKVHVASAMSWCPKLSDHRPVSFSRKCPQPKGSIGDKPIPCAILSHPDWKERVQGRFEELAARDSLADRPLRRLNLIKRAMKEISSQMTSEVHVSKAESLEDQLGWTMRFIKAAQHVRLSTMEKCARAYPYLAELVSPSDPLLREGSRLDSVRWHAVELARRNVMADLAHVENSESHADEQYRQRKKEQILTKLKRLVPGVTPCLAAVQSPGGDVITDPKGMADSLSKHWNTGFAGKQINECKLCDWMSEEFGSFEDITLEQLGLPSRDSPRWRARRRDVARAIS